MSKESNHIFSRKKSIRKKKTKVIIGHDVNFDTKFLVTGKRIREAVTFRDPHKWEISRYNQHVNRMVMRNKAPISFKTWLTEVNKFHSQFDWFLANYMGLKGLVHKLSNSIKTFILKQALNQIELVYTVENFAELLSFLLAELNLPQDLTEMKNQNVVGVHKVNYFQHTSENTAALNQHCEFDILCYQIVKQLEAERNYK